MDQRLTLLTLGVDDVARARAFYAKLGWKPANPDDDDIAFFQCGGMVVSLWGRAQLAEDSCLPLSDGGSGGVCTPACNVGSPEEVDAVLAEAELAGARIGRPGAATCSPRPRRRRDATAGPARCVVAGSPSGRAGARAGRRCLRWALHRRRDLAPCGPHRSHQRDRPAPARRVRLPVSPACVRRRALVGRARRNRRRVGEAFGEMIDNGVPLAASGLDVLRNRVVLELFRDLERYAPILQARFGPGVVVERGELVTLA